MIKDLVSDPLDGGTDKSGRTRSMATTEIKEYSGDGFPAGFVGVWAMLPASPTCSAKAVRAGEVSSTPQEIVYQRKLVLGPVNIWSWWYERVKFMLL